MHVSRTALALSAVAALVGAATVRRALFILRRPSRLPQVKVAYYKCQRDFHPHH